MALRQQLQQKQQQKLTPLQMQVIKLTELPCLELEEKIKQELVDNPALEEGYENRDQEEYADNNLDEGADITQEEIVLGDYINEDEIPDYSMANIPRSEEAKRNEIPFSIAESFHEALISQLQMSELTESDKKIAEYIIGNIDENGYLERSMTAISDDLLFQVGIEVDAKKLESILKVIQDFEPSGVGARNLQECLSLQLEKKHETKIVTLAKLTIKNYFDEFSKKHYDKIKKGLGIETDEILKEVIDEITSLNPKPGNSWDSPLASVIGTIIPDFIVELYNGELFLSLNNRNIPELRVSREYSDMLRGYTENKKSMNNDTKNALMFVRQKLDSARWFIDALKQRQETLQRTMEAIMNFQYDFFLSGDETQLKPMILKDIAEIAGYDISTISRVSNSKYVQANFGVYPLKYFFSESMQNKAGEEISSREVKAILKECIDSEDRKKPLADDKLVDLLKERGYLIARRTVAKYREQMNIPVARLRKEV